MPALRGGCLVALVLFGCGDTGSRATQPADLAVAGDMVAPRDMAKAPRDIVMLGPCDTVKQDCVDPANKCTTVADPDDPMMQGLITNCIPITGMKGRDESCMRTGPNMPPTANAGHDDCAAGFFCSSNGTLVADFSQRHCRSFCRTDADCKDTPTGKCVGLIPMDTGLCAPTCALFGADCPMGLECAVLIGKFDTTGFVTTCRGVGMTALGAACMAATDCVAGATCIDPTNMNKASKCTQLCDDAHACPNGMMCVPAMGLAKSGGICR